MHVINYMQHSAGGKHANYNICDFGMGRYWLLISIPLNMCDDVVGLVCRSIILSQVIFFCGLCVHILKRI
jgi:hypothetical protein